ncbi:hypothetical protein [Limosilactobacillus walteri]|uniref:Uncharacterized protein n=1 Tax=Limosilactobacillus walteri TaxID=2268022 RepID=A0ABR8P408_9LACO|nr:hypothetical protein [Limosilactobacillus walteri]MBD5805654.1 hypothetical protein [Limosilactobacillus walteri]
MIASLLTGMVGGAGVLGAGYGIAKKKLQNEPLTAIKKFQSEKEQNDQRSDALSKKEVELKKREKELQERSGFLDKRYDEIVDDDESNRQIADYYNDLIQREQNDWKKWREKQNPKKGEKPVLELVKRNAAARSEKGYFKYLHDHRGALTDTQYGIFLELQDLLAKEFSNSEYKAFLMGLYRFLCREGYNPYLVSWMLMTAFHNV